MLWEVADGFEFLLPQLMLVLGLGPRTVPYPTSMSLPSLTPRTILTNLADLAVLTVPAIFIRPSWPDLAWLACQLPWLASLVGEVCGVMFSHTISYVNTPFSVFQVVIASAICYSWKFISVAGLVNTTVLPSGITTVMIMMGQTTILVLH